MLAITRSDAERLLKSAQSAKASIKRARERADEAIGRVVQTTEIGSAAFVMGVVNGRWNGVEVLGVPLDLLLGGGLHVLAFAGVASDHLHNFGDGSLASYSTTLGAGIGREMAQKAAVAPGGTTATGYRFAAGAGPLSDAQLADLARRAA